MRFIFVYVLFAGLCLSSCSQDDSLNVIDNLAEIQKDGLKNTANTTENEKYLVQFANILSRAVYDRKDVREFLKRESLKQFDKNYDVLYYLIKDEKVGEKSFRNLLISYSSEKAIEEIETKIPLLNIYVSKIEIFEIFPENLNTEDNEIPVVVSRKSKTSLYFNGKEELNLEKGEIPNFHVFVVNENSRVIIPEHASNRLKSNGPKTIMFKSPNYEGGSSNNKQASFKANFSDFNTVGQKAIDAFKYFNKDDGSINQKAYQRDYVYYGITPENQTGSLNRSVSEYISFIEINPNSYFNMADQKLPNTINNDPRINSQDGTSGTTSQEKRGLSEQELIDRLWTIGSYNFRFEIISSTAEQAQIVYVPLRPEQIWDFNIDHSYRHSTMFRRSKNTYTINANKFTSKRVFLDYMVSLGKWHISEEALYRYVKIYEEDESVEVTETETYDMTNALKINFNAEGNKYGVGLKAGLESTTTEKVSKSYTLKRKQDSDLLGVVKIYFYDPLVEDVSITNNTCSIYTYNTGNVKFGIAVK